MAEDNGAIDKALPEPQPLIGIQDDKWDRTQWWETA